MLAWTLVLADGVAFLLAFALTSARFGDSVRSAQAMLPVGATLSMITVFAAFGLYRPGFLSLSGEWRRIASAASVVTAAVLTYASLFDTNLRARDIGLIWIGTFGLGGTTRSLVSFASRASAINRRISSRTLVIASNGEATALTEDLQRSRSGLIPIGIVASSPHVTQDECLPVLGSLDHLGELVQRHSADCIFVASTAVSPRQMAEITRVAHCEKVELRLSADLPFTLPSRVSVEQFGATMAVSVVPARLTGVQLALKRAMDLLISVFVLIVTLPLWLVIAVAIKVESKGPVLYRRGRVGRDGVPFTMLKFRTMVVGAEAMLEQLSSMNEAPGPLFKVRQDPRTTRLGRVLRSWSLEELPQLLNVVRGDMSLVGPRPPLPGEVEQYEEWHRERLNARPGMTGLWQVSGRCEASFDDYVRYDLSYIRNWSLRFDLSILLKTPAAVLVRKGAY